MIVPIVFATHPPFSTKRKRCTKVWRVRFLSIHEKEIAFSVGTLVQKERERASRDFVALFMYPITATLP